jgi:HAE1 family hydrophobic/amphiphilic exporter-1
MSKLFINRPIVAMGISIVMVIVGAVTIVALPVAQFPNIVPPEIQVLATYVGADAQILEQSVSTPIEQQMSGVDNMNYMYSLNSTADGLARMIVNYDVKTEPNTDLMLTQMRTTQASQLPSDVTNYGVTVQKTVTAPLMLITLYSPHGTYDARFLANYAYMMGDNQKSRSDQRQLEFPISDNSQALVCVLGGTQNLVTDKQVRRLFALGKVETNLETAAAKAGMDAKTAGSIAGWGECRAS